MFPVSYWQEGQIPGVAGSGKSLNQWGRNKRNICPPVGHTCTLVWIELHSHSLLLYIWTHVYSTNVSTIMGIIRSMVVRPLTGNSVWICLKSDCWGGSSFPKATKQIIDLITVERCCDILLKFMQGQYSQALASSTYVLKSILLDKLISALLYLQIKHFVETVKR